jgi:hypothetical protein
MQMKCGYCDGVIAKSRLSSSLSYKKRCVCCNKEYPIKDSCAQEMFKKSTKKKHSDRITPKDFNNSSIHLYCINCKEDCFYCKRSHIGK